MTDLSRLNDPDWQKLLTYLSVCSDGHADGDKVPVLTWNYQKSKAIPCVLGRSAFEGQRKNPPDESDGNEVSVFGDDNLLSCCFTGVDALELRR